MAKKKVNPNRVPASYADLDKAKKKARDEAIEYVWAIFMTVMRDKEGYGKGRLNRLWGHVNDLSDSISAGYVSINDLKQTILEEAGIRLTSTKGRK